MIIFGDLETTGLDPERDFILEIALIVTDDNFNVLGGAQELVRPITCHQYPEYWKTLDPAVQKMHQESGLFADVEREGKRRSDVEADLVRWLVTFPRGVEGPALRDPELGQPNYPSASFTLAGNSIWFDAAFIRKHMPKLAELLGRRLLDVTTINQVAKRLAPATFNERPREPGKKHRAADDAHHSLEVMRFYRDHGLFGGS